MKKESGFDWSVEEKQSILGNIFRPMVKIKIKTKSGDWEEFACEIDSGSPITVLNESDCEVLGYKLESGIHFKIYGVFNEFRDAYIHTLEMKIGNNIIMPKIAFTQGRNHKQLLGREDVFSNFHIDIRGKWLKSYFIKAV